MAPPKNITLTASSTDRTSAGAINAHGDAKAKIGLVWVFGILLGLYIVCGSVILVLKPEIGTSFWENGRTIILPLITGFFGFLAGNKSK